MLPVILNAAQVARIIGCGEQKVRERIKRKIWTFGVVVTAKQKGQKSNSYEVNWVLLRDYLKITDEEMERRLREVEDKKAG